MLHIEQMRVIGKSQLYLRFNDGLEGDLDLIPMMNRGLFADLQDPELFSKAELDEDGYTVVWPNGAHPAPESLHDLLHQQQRQLVSSSSAGG